MSGICSRHRGHDPECRLCCYEIPRCERCGVTALTFDQSQHICEQEVDAFLAACETKSASPRNDTVSIKQNTDGTTTVRIDLRQVRVIPSPPEKSEDHLELVLEPKGK